MSPSGAALKAQHYIAIVREEGFSTHIHSYPQKFAFCSQILHGNVDSVGQKVLMAYPGEWLSGYGLAPEFGSEERFDFKESTTDLLHIGSAESLISFELARCLIHASRNLTYRVDAPLEIPRGDSITWLRKSLLSPVCIDKYRDWMEMIDPCESPLEAVSFLGLCASLSIAEIPLIVTKPGEVPALPILDDRMTVAQVVLQEPADKYRIDIALHFNCRLGKNLYRQNMAIECDGADYHSSPIQLAYDETKDRELTASGYSVLRFAGKDVWNNPRWCNKQITDPVFRFCRQLIEGPLPEIAHPISTTNPVSEKTALSDMTSHRPDK